MTSSIEADILSLKLNEYWDVSVWDGIKKILNNYQRDPETKRLDESNVKEALRKIEKFYERSSYTFKMALKGNVHFLSPDSNEEDFIQKINENNNLKDEQLAKKIFIYFSHDLIEENFLEWTKWLTSVVQLSLMNKRECKFCLVDYDLHGQAEVKIKYFFKDWTN